MTNTAKPAHNSRAVLHKEKQTEPDNQRTSDSTGRVELKVKITRRPKFDSYPIVAGVTKNLMKKRHITQVVYPQFVRQFAY